jgi:CheY-like chemotaxis protein
MAEVPRVLMVDNNPGDLELAHLAIEEAGLVVDFAVARDGKEGQLALQRMSDGQERRCQAMLLDLNMPRMDGRQLLSWARAQPDFAELPIIILTSSHVDRDRVDCLAMGATAVWVKPLDFDCYVELMAKLTRFFGS